MKRVMRVTAKREGVSAHVGINVMTEPGYLTPDELDHLKHIVTSGVMKVLADARYLHVGLSQIKVE